MTSVRSVVSLDMLAEGQVTTDLALVAKQAGRLGAAGDEEVRASIVIAVEDGHAATGEELELAVVAVLKAGARGLFHERGHLGAALGGLGREGRGRQDEQDGQEGRDERAQGAFHDGAQSTGALATWRRPE